MYSARPFYTDGGALAPGSFDGDLDKGDPDTGSAMGTPLEGGSESPAHCVLMPSRLSAACPDTAWHKCGTSVKSSSTMRVECGTSTLLGDCS